MIEVKLLLSGFFFAFRYCLLNYFVEFALLNHEAPYMGCALEVAIHLNVLLLLAFAMFIIHLIGIFV